MQENLIPTETGDDLAARLLSSSRDDMRLIGVFVAEPADGARNGVADLIALSRLFRIDEVIVAVSGTAGERVETIVRKLGTIPTDVHLCPEMPILGVAPLKAGLLFGQAVMTVFHRPLIGWNRVVKRAEDIVLSAVALLVLSPLMVLVALLIKLDSPSPVLFRQKRLGFNNNVITTRWRTTTNTRR